MPRTNGSALGSLLVHSTSGTIARQCKGLRKRTGAVVDNWPRHQMNGKPPTKRKEETSRFPYVRRRTSSLPVRRVQSARRRGRRDDAIARGRVLAGGPLFGAGRAPGAQKPAVRGPAPCLRADRPPRTASRARSAGPPVSSGLSSRGVATTPLRRLGALTDGAQAEWSLHMTQGLSRRPIERPPRSSRGVQKENGRSSCTML